VSFCSFLAFAVITVFYECVFHEGGFRETHSADKSALTLRQGVRDPLVSLPCFLADALHGSWPFSSKTLRLAPFCNAPQRNRIRVLSHLHSSHRSFDRAWSSKTAPTEIGAWAGRPGQTALRTTALQSCERHCPRQSPRGPHAGCGPTRKRHAVRLYVVCVSLPWRCVRGRSIGTRHAVRFALLLYRRMGAFIHVAIASHLVDTSHVPADYNLLLSFSGRPISQRRSISTSFH